MQLRGRAEEIRRRNGRLVLIGNGTAEQAAEFRIEFSGELELLTDPDLVGYRAAGLKRSLLTSVRPSTAVDFFRAWRAGYRPGNLDGDAAQLGGAFVITPEQRLLYAMVADSIDEKPEFSDIIAALDRAREAA